MNEPTLKDVMAAIAALGARLERLEKRESTSAARVEQIRVQKREAQARWRAKLASVESTHPVESTKETEEGKEEIPPTPPKGVKGEEKEKGKNDHHTRACARDGVVADECERPTELEVVAYFQERGFALDPHLFWNYNQVRDWKLNNKKIGDWRALAWMWENDKGQDIKGSTVKPPSVDAFNFFTDFWENYPNIERKGNKQKCEKKFYKILGDDPEKQCEIYNRIMEGLSRWKASYRWQKEGGEYICAPLVWLNQSRWAIIPDEKTKGTGNGYPRRSISQLANVLSKEADGAF